MKVDIAEKAKNATCVELTTDILAVPFALMLVEVVAYITREGPTDLKTVLRYCGSDSAIVEDARADVLIFLADKGYIILSE